MSHRAKCGVCGSRWVSEKPIENTFCPDCYGKGNGLSGVLNSEPDEDHSDTCEIDLLKTELATARRWAKRWKQQAIMATRSERYTRDIARMDAQWCDEAETRCVRLLEDRADLRKQLAAKDERLAEMAAAALCWKPMSEFTKRRERMVLVLPAGSEVPKLMRTLPEDAAYDLVDSENTYHAGRLFTHFAELPADPESPLADSARTILAALKADQRRKGAAWALRDLSAILEADKENPLRIMVGWLQVRAAAIERGEVEVGE